METYTKVQGNEYDITLEIKNSENIMKKYKFNLFHNGKYLH